MTFWTDLLRNEIFVSAATGVRRETGIQAMVLNEMIAFFKKMGGKVSIEEKLKEFVGHTPLQVLAGALLGILIAYCVHMIFPIK